MEKKLHIGVMTGFPEPASAKRHVEQAESLGFDSLWVGDHIAFPVPILDSLSQLALASAYSRTITLGTCVYLLPLRHPTPVAKQVGTLDKMSGGRLILGVGVGGEFRNEYAACGVPVNERGARLTESIEVLKALWTGESVTREGRFYPLQDIQMLPKPEQPGGPPIWCGGRSDGALKRAGRLADGYISYAIDPPRYRKSREIIEEEARKTGRRSDCITFGHMLFTRIGQSFEEAHEIATGHLSKRYAMDFGPAAKRYAALGQPADVAESISLFCNEGVSHLVLDLTGPLNDRENQLQWFSEEVMPLLG